MTPFKHKFAKNYRVEYTPVSGGGLVASSLTVVANIPLQAGLPSYNSGNVSTLTNAAVEYAKTRGIASVFVESDV